MMIFISQGWVLAHYFSQRLYVACLTTLMTLLDCKDIPLYLPNWMAWRGWSASSWECRPVPPPWVISVCRDQPMGALCEVSRCPFSADRIQYATDGAQLTHHSLGQPQRRPRSPEEEDDQSHHSLGSVFTSFLLQPSQGPRPHTAGEFSCSPEFEFPINCGRPWVCELSTFL